MQCLDGEENNTCFYLVWVVLWMGKVPMGSRIWTLGLQLVVIFEKIVECPTASCFSAVGVRGRYPGAVAYSWEEAGPSLKRSPQWFLVSSLGTWVPTVHNREFQSGTRGWRSTFCLWTSVHQVKKAWQSPGRAETGLTGSEDWVYWKGWRGDSLP